MTRDEPRIPTEQFGMQSTVYDSTRASGQPVDNPKIQLGTLRNEWQVYVAYDSDLGCMGTARVANYTSAHMPRSAPRSALLVVRLWLH